MAPRPQKFPAFMEELGFGTYGTRCSFPAGPLDASGRTMLVRFPDTGNGSSPSEVPSLHGGACLAGFTPVDSTIVALVKAPPVGGLARDPACPNPQCKVTETYLKRAYAAEAQLGFGTYGTRCSFPAGPLDASGRTMLVRFPDTGNGSSPSEVPSLHGGGEAGEEEEEDEEDHEGSLLREDLLLSLSTESSGGYNPLRGEPCPGGMDEDHSTQLPDTRFSSVHLEKDAQNSQKLWLRKTPVDPSTCGWKGSPD
ncbi:UNVERIFIED_CONTAM: hypothetical protein FKN15_065109 [Acipenser sinensis]